MESKFLAYTTTQVGRITGLHSKTILGYCKKGLLRASRSGETGDFCILGEDLLEFLYKSPTLSDYARRYSRTPDVGHILKEIAKRPKMYSMDEICKIFNKSRATVSLWVRLGYITPYGYERGTQQNPYFRKEDIFLMLKKIPRLRKIYTDYCRKNIKSIACSG